MGGSSLGGRVSQEKPPSGGYRVTGVNTSAPQKKQSAPSEQNTSATLKYSPKNPRVRNSGAGNGCVNFMDAWKNAFFLQEKTPVHKIPRFRGGGLGFLGGPCRFYFYGRADFLI